MQKYIGVKIVEAEPMAVDVSPQYPTQMQGHNLGDLGYEVTYEGGYKSWCPKEEFEAANQPIDSMDFSRALAAMLQGHRVSRKAFNGFFFHVRLGEFGAELPPAEAFEDGVIPPLAQEDADNNFFLLHTEEREDLVNWGPTHSEMQATDWYIWTEEEAQARYDAHIAALEAAEQQPE